MTSFRADARRDMLAVTALRQQLLGDLDLAEGGISWWAGRGLAPWQSILISDYLLAALAAVESQLLQAATFAERYEGKAHARDIALRTQIRNGQFGGPGSVRFLADLNDNELHTHLTDFFVAVVGALDNLTAVIIGVGGLRSNIKRASATRGPAFGRGVSADRQRMPAGTPGRRAQDDYLEDLQAAFAGEPKGWLEWANDMRNMRVHRGQRINIVRADTKAPATLYRALPRHPGQSDVEAWSHLGIEQVLLDEDALVTISGVLASTLQACRVTVSASVALWDARRRAPELIEQPASQWPELEPPGASFDGYKDSGPARWRKPPPSVGSLHLSPEDSRRLLAAQVMSADRLKWQRWQSEAWDRD